MERTNLDPARQQVLQGYGDGGFRISGQRYEGSVLVFPRRVVAWPVASLADLTEDSLAEVLAARHSVAEGVWTARSVMGLAAALGVEMPICAAVDAVLHHGAGIEDTIAGLLSRPFRIETH